MKRFIFFSVLLCFCFAKNVEAQTSKTHFLNSHQASKKKLAQKKYTKANKEQAAMQNSTSLTSTSTNQAYGSAAKRFAISDPMINRLNLRATGDNAPISSSGIVGMPKGTYGFANGKILLRSTTATSSGTSYGSGAVGTGTTITGVGTGENVIGVNGKNPYAGPWLWGDRLPVKSSLRQQ